MNRTLKFRAWDKRNSRWFGRYVDETLENLTVDFEIAPDPDRFIVMQFTGLLDKNGKDTFELDVLKSFHFSDGKRDYFLYHVVKWSEKYLCWVAVSTGNKSDDIAVNGNPQLYLYARNTEFEVIGNLFENPELLK